MATSEEVNWFSDNINISGYASDDGYIVLNPFSKLSKREIEGVCINEAIRLFMHEYQITPRIRLTRLQVLFFNGTHYEKKISEIKKTVIARIIAGDPSAQNFTPHQNKIANEIHKLATNKSKCL